MMIRRRRRTRMRTKTRRTKSWKQKSPSSLCLSMSPERLKKKKKSQITSRELECSISKVELNKLLTASAVDRTISVQRKTPAIFMIFMLHTH